MRLITTFVELRVVAGRSRTRAGSPQADSRRTCCAVALRRTTCTFMMSRFYFFRKRNVLDKSCGDRAHILCPLHLSRKSCRLWGNVEECSRAGQAAAHNIIESVRFACWITKATQKHTQYVMLIAFSTATVVMRNRIGVTFYVCGLFCC